MRDEDVLCIQCGVPEGEHHEFQAPPKDCVCNPDGWRFSRHVPDPCGTFVEAGYDPSRCNNCEHDMECHAP